MIDNVLTFANRPKYGNRMKLIAQISGIVLRYNSRSVTYGAAPGENRTTQLPCPYRSSSILCFEMEFIQLPM